MSRITPAGAGKTGKARKTFRTPQDHPRRCGENRPINVYGIKKVGSPPQVRGKHLLLLLRYVLARITPAGAGKTHEAFEAACMYLDHPRRCGENNESFCPAVTDRGSPPQVRGKHCDAANCTNDIRITPAGAGKTPTTTFFAKLFEDHPRRCGENLSFSLPKIPVPGSPPQVRGKRKHERK